MHTERWRKSPLFYTDKLSIHDPGCGLPPLIRSGFGLAAAIVTAASLVGAPVVSSPLSGAEPVATAGAGGSFGFKALEIFKASANTSSLSVADVNGDGRLDFVYPDNNESTFRFLLQRAPGDPLPGEDVDGATKSVVKSSLNEVKSDPRFRVEKFYADAHVNSFVTADFNSDGRPDIAYYSDPPELVVVLQEEPWGSNRRRFSIKDGSESPYALETADLNGDQRSDLLLLSDHKTYLFYQDANGSLQQPALIYHPAAEAFDVEAADLNDDGRLDLLYVAPQADDSVYVQLQGEGGFSTARVVRLRALNSWYVAPYRFGRKQKAIATLFGVEAASRRLKVHRWERRDTDHGVSSANIVALGPDGDPRKRRRLIADVNLDGRVDLAVSVAETAQLHVYFQDQHGELSTRETYATFAAVNGLLAVDVDGDGSREIVVTSEQEKAIGISRWDGARLTLPKRYSLEEPPLLLAQPAAANDDNRLVVVLSKGAKRGTYDLSEYSFVGSEATVKRSVNLKLKSRAGDVRLFDVEGDGDLDALVLVPFAPPVLVVSQSDADGEFEIASDDAAAGLGQLSGVAATAIRTLPAKQFDAATASDDGKGDALVLSKGSYVRFLRYTDGQLTVVDQISGRDSSAKIASATLVQLDDDPEPEIALLDGERSELEIVDRLQGGDYARLHTLRVPKIELEDVVARDMNGDGRDDLVLLGQRVVTIFYRIDSEAGFRERQNFTVEKHEEIGRPLDLTVGDLNGDSQSDVVLATVPRYNLLCLSAEEEATAEGSEVSGSASEEDAARESERSQSVTLKTRLAFTLFEEKSYMRRGGGGGPRFMTIADVDGDQLDDLVLLIHDRILLYLQDAAPNSDSHHGAQ